MYQNSKIPLAHTDVTNSFRRYGRRTLGGIWILGLFLLHLPLLAQDPHFSQYYAAPLYLNPALMGAERDMAFSMNHRSQWRSLGFPQNTSQFSFVAALAKPNLSRQPRYCLGLSAFSDVAGEQGSYVAMGATASAAYNLSLNSAGSQAISLGIQVGLTQKSLNADQLKWGSQFDPSMGYNPDLPATARQDLYQTLFPVLNAGLAWFFNPRKSRLISDFSAYSGVAFSNLNRPSESFFSESPVRLPILLKLHGGADVALSPSLALSPAYLLMQQNGRTQVNLGTYLTYHSAGRHSAGRGNATQKRVQKYTVRPSAASAKAIRLSLGGWYRFGDSVIASVGVSQQRFTLGFSYDFNVSTLGQYTGGQGAYELSMTYRILRNHQLRRFSMPMM